MKRSHDTKTLVSGTDFKKIKKLSFMLNQDKDDERNVIQAPKVQKNVPLPVDKDESDEGSESEEECVLSSHDDECLNDEDRKILEKYNTLEVAEDIVSGFDAAREEVASNMGFDDFEEFDETLPAEHIAQLTQLMTTHRPNKMCPKTIKVLPQIANWVYILEQLSFPKWTPSAVQALAGHFRAKGNDIAVVFYRDFLLPYVRENIAKNARLDNILFQTLKDALYRRKEFMQGIFYQWCCDDISGKEAEVLANVIKNATVKPDVARPAMLCLVRLDYSKGRLLILHSFLEKKYVLPVVLISAIVTYFHKMAVKDVSSHFTERGVLPLSWFQSLNLFVSQSYAHLSDEDHQRLISLCKVHRHEKVTPSIQAYLKMRAAAVAKMETE